MTKSSTKQALSLFIFSGAKAERLVGYRGQKEILQLLVQDLNELQGSSLFHGRASEPTIASRCRYHVLRNQTNQQPDGNFPSHSFGKIPYNLRAWEKKQRQLQIKSSCRSLRALQCNLDVLYWFIHTEDINCGTYRPIAAPRTMLVYLSTPGLVPD